MNPGLWWNFQPPWPISQTLRWKNAVFTCIWNHSVLQNGKLSFPNGQNPSSLYFFFQNSKCLLILFEYTNVFLYAKFGDLKPTINKKWRPQIWTCLWARHRKKIPQGNCDFLLTKCFTNVNQSSGSTERAAESFHTVQRGMARRRMRAPKWEHVCTTGQYDVKDHHAQLLAQWLTRKHDKRAGNQSSKNQRVEGKISIVQSMQFGFLPSLGSATSNEANKSVMQPAEWTIIERKLCSPSGAQMKYRYFDPESCKQNAIFSGTSYQNRSDISR